MEQSGNCSDGPRYWLLHYRRPKLLSLVYVKRNVVPEVDDRLAKTAREQHLSYTITWNTVCNQVAN